MLIRFKQLPAQRRAHERGYGPKGGLAQPAARRLLLLRLGRPTERCILPPRPPLVVQHLSNSRLSSMCDSQSLHRQHAQRIAAEASAALCVRGLSPHNCECRTEQQCSSQALTHREGPTKPRTSCRPPSSSGQPCAGWNCVPAMVGCPRSQRQRHAECLAARRPTGGIQMQEI
jgi:hypothetical protein